MWRYGAGSELPCDEWGPKDEASVEIDWDVYEASVGGEPKDEVSVGFELCYG